MINAIIVDDEIILAEELGRMLKLYHSDVKVVSVCDTIGGAIESIIKYNPDLVFLDVELGNGLTSFDLLKSLPAINFDVIFTTGFDQYAIQAIKLSAIDFLLKPIDEVELKSAIEKFRDKNLKVDSSKIENFLSVWANPGNQLNKMMLPTMSGYDLVAIADIIYCEGLSNQTLLVLNNKKETIISMTLKECEDILTPYGFFRIHRSYLINLNHVKRYVKVKDGSVIMSNESSLAVSGSFKEKFIEKLRIP